MGVWYNNSEVLDYWILNQVQNDRGVQNDGGLVWQCVVRGERKEFGVVAWGTEWQ